MRKTITSLILVFVLAFSFTANVFAQPADTQNIGVSPYEPGGGISVFGLDPPVFNNWDVTVKGRYNFSGEATGSNLYTNYTFTGRTAYTVYVNNKGSQDLDLFVKTTFGSYGRFTVKAESTKTLYPSGMDETDKIYILFYAPSYFDGYIE